MPRSNDEKKVIESRVLIAARKAGIPVPFGGTPGEEPDFRFNQDASNLPGPNNILNFGGLTLPEGFGSMSLWQESRDWWCGEGGGYTVSDIQQALASSIAAKNKLVPAYRKNLVRGDASAFARFIFLG